MEKALRATLPEGGFVRVPPARSKVMSLIRSRGNKSTEQRLRLALVRAQLKGWRIQCLQLPGRPDFYFSDRKVAVFVDGCFWHGCPRCGHIPATNKRFWRLKIERNRKRDSNSNRKLRAQGIAVLRFWEHEIQRDVDKCVQKIFNCRAGAIS